MRHWCFWPLAQCWKRIVTLTSQSLITITKDNLLKYYHIARVEGLKTLAVLSAFRKTGIWPLNCHAIPITAFALAQNTTTQADSHSQLPALLVPTPVPTPTPSPTTTPTPSGAPTQVSAAVSLGSNAGDEAEEEVIEQYHIEVTSPLPGTASHAALRVENMKLHDIIV
jgi:hypothetical protein